MPELAEVEVVRDVLNNSLKGLVITGIECSYKPIIEDDFAYFTSKVLNKRIVEIKRYAKYLIFILEDGAFISHLRMEGKYFYVLESETISKHVHVIFHLSNGHKLLYADVRKFGRIVYKPLEEIYNTLPLSNIGVEANNPVYNRDELFKAITNKRLPIKTVLLDQSIISGLGNIYVDEVLFACGISPFTEAKCITLEQIDLIMNNSLRILNKAIENKGTTIRSYTSSLGVTGNYQNFLCVHTKTVCPNCKATLGKTKINGRTSYYCPNCQK